MNNGFIFQNPYGFQNQYQVQANNQSVIRVNGVEGAKAYQMQQPNSTVALFDNNNDIFFLKTTDGACFPSIRTFKFEEIIDKPAPVVEYVSKSEFEELRKEVAEYGKQFIRTSEPISKPDK